MKFDPRLFIALALYSFLIGNAHAEATQASFDCSLARTPIEKTICQDDGLKQQDADLAKAYHKTLQAAANEDEQHRVQQEENAWLEKRNSSCVLPLLNHPAEASGSDVSVDCLADLYQKRLDDLAGTQPSKEALSSRSNAFTPTLTLSKNDKVCMLFEKAVQKDYSTSSSGAFGASELLHKPLVLKNGRWLPESEGTSFFTVKNGGHKQTVLFKEYPLHSESYGISVYLKDGEASDEEENTITEGNPWDDGYLKKNGWKSVFRQETNNNLFPFHVLWLNNSLYILRDGLTEYREYDREETEDLAANVVGLYRVKTDGGILPSCLVSAAPPVAIGADVYVLDKKLVKNTKLKPLISSPKSINDLFDALNALDVSGEPRGCGGGSHTGFVWWAYHEARNRSRYLALAEPRETPDVNGGNALAFMNSWGLRNLFNYKIYRNITGVIPKAQEELESYYQDQFGATPADAQSMAKASMGNILTKSLWISSLTDWDAIKEAGLGDTAFKKKYRVQLSKHEAVPDASIRKAVLLGMDDLVNETPKELIVALNKTDPAIKLREGNSIEPTIFYALDNPEMLSTLLSKGADVNAVNWFGKTALMYAAQWDLPEAIKILAAAHADVNIATIPLDRFECGPSISKRTALMYAAENAPASTIEMLIESGADKKAKDSSGRSVFDYLALNHILSDVEREKIGSELQ